MCFTVAQYIKVAQARMRYWNARNKAQKAEERYVASAFLHPELLIVKQDQEEPVLESASWGLIPYWCKTDENAKELSNITLNARGETIFEKPSFKDAAIHSRCIIPVNGFFEYQHNGKARIPFFISIENEPIFSLGGLYSEWISSSTGQLTKTFSIVTTEANPLMEIIHNSKKRMPLILKQDDEQLWLNGAPHEIKHLIKPSDNSHIKAWRVKSFIVKGNILNTHQAIEPIDSPLLL